jgi:hypothetical protein
LAAASLDSMCNLLREMSTRQAGQAGAEDVQGLSWRLAEVAGRLDRMVMMEEDAASRAREEGGCIGGGAAQQGRGGGATREDVRASRRRGGEDFRRNDDGKRMARDEDKQ